MTTTIQKWGNSQGIRIPKFILEAVHWNGNERLVVSAENDKIIIERAEKRKNIKELFDDFDEEASAEFSIAVLKSKELMNIAAFCGKTGSRLKAALYKYRGGYFLLADISRCQVREIAQLLCLADEYVDEICYTKSIAAFLREHGQCVIKENAAAVLGNL